MRMVLTGHKGQLGRALLPLLAGHEVAGVDLPEYDITDRGALRAAIRDFRPDLILHPAAMTDVEGCARDPDLAYRVNGMGTQNVALAAAEVGAEMLYVSTNEVFDGQATEPYHEWAPRNPINAYGRSKLAGEWYVQNLLTRFYIVRTAWLYAPGGRNFPHRILQLADERGSLKVVADEVGNPTYVVDLARAIAALIETHAYGVYHAVNAGAASRYDFAREILRLSGRESIPVEPLALAEFQRASTPPAYAPLANNAAAALGITFRPWQAALAEFLSA
ncbi:MAG TPA: dTDP-4-dehydrorhamnose reductase [Anaerolineae bacterium]|nr:MAG: dTDP-4-dehydrorhamnose reductase [Chloroflexi bacterium ADurb.Bin222]HOC20734.1 dTDP-4-dehydrorhamnose reductase [Anaerolineae bacterium]HQM15300.1 dTDP-4-dehydrorhamnose reductase [Anaerolineae bacterium]